MSHISPVKQRLRIHFGKNGPMKYTGNLDIAKTWERVLRRANLPLLYTEGFNTRPRIQLASALPLGITSECEIIDVALKEPIELDGLKERLLATSPTGLEIYRIESVPIDGPALQTLVRSAEYRIEFKEPIDTQALENKIRDMLAQDAIIIERVKKRKRREKRIKVDLRPLIHELRMEDEQTLIAHLSVGDEGNMRPEKLLELLGLAESYFTIHRYRLHLAEETKN
ncbi:MAG: DUF2344 domain-containing protein [Chloroflexi bacterium]|nr:MAG: DUF2344 domain-containing protein [Chloroflexota bacterium]